MLHHRLVIIGGGPAGLAAAHGAYEEGERDILILEREEHLGGILNQCIHNGFGLHTFKEELTVPEYASRFIELVKKDNIPYKLNTTVIDVNKDKIITAVNQEDGLLLIKADAIILACGCRERPRGAINIAGARCAGIYSAGTAQKLVNIDGLKVGKEVVILGSGDIGLIMARRMTFEGAKVKAVCELMPYSSGLNRNIVQCLNDFDIPLYFSHTVIKINGKDRVESVVVAKVDEKLNPILDTAFEIKCDTLLLSVGLLPENELARTCGVELSRVTNGAIVDESMMTSMDGIFECGNVLHVHDLVDYVSEESTNAGKSAVRYLNKSISSRDQVLEVKTSNGVRYSVPQLIKKDTDYTPIQFKMRVSNVFKNVEVALFVDGEKVAKKIKQIVTPGEMETLLVKEDIVKKIKSGQNVELTLVKRG